MKVQDQFLRFRKVHFESYNNHLTESGQESIKNASPAFTMFVKGFDGKSSKFDLFWKQNESGPDEEYMYGLTTAGEIVLVQRYVFDPLIEVLSDF